MADKQAFFYWADVPYPTKIRGMPTGEAVIHDLAHEETILSVLNGIKSQGWHTATASDLDAYGECIGDKEYLPRIRQEVMIPFRLVDGKVVVMRPSENPTGFNPVFLDPHETLREGSRILAIRPAPKRSPIVVPTKG